MTPILSDTGGGSNVARDLVKAVFRTRIRLLSSNGGYPDFYVLQLVG